MIRTGIIRQRGQVTIPSSIRSEVPWVKSNSVVTIILEKADEIMIRPYEKFKKKVNWEKLWRLIAEVRGYKGKGGNLSKFIIEDRKSH